MLKEKEAQVSAGDLLMAKCAAKKLKKWLEKPVCAAAQRAAEAVLALAAEAEKEAGKLNII